jgi:hypothetical protein
VKKLYNPLAGIKKAIAAGNKCGNGLLKMQVFDL